MADTSIYYESPATSGGVLSMAGKTGDPTAKRKVTAGSQPTEAPSVGSSMFSALRSMTGPSFGGGGGMPGFGSTPAFGSGAYGSGLMGALGSGASWNLQAQQQQGGQGQVVKGPDGRLYVNQGGQWVPLQ